MENGGSGEGRGGGGGGGGGEEEEAGEQPKTRTPHRDAGKKMCLYFVLFVCFCWHYKVLAESFVFGWRVRGLFHPRLKDWRILSPVSHIERQVVR